MSDYDLGFGPQFSSGPGIPPTSPDMEPLANKWEKGAREEQAEMANQGLKTLQGRIVRDFGMIKPIYLLQWKQVLALECQGSPPNTYYFKISHTWILQDD